MTARVALALALALGMIGCGPSTPDTGSSSPPAATVPTPVQPASTVPAASDALTIAAEHYAAGEAPLSLQSGADDQPARYFDVVDCNDGTRAIDPGDTRPDRDEVLARRIALLRRSLRLVGYGPAVIEGPLADYAAAAHSDDPEREQADYARLAAALEAKRAALQPDKPPIRAEGGCGAAETPIVVRSRPADGHVWLITQFAFDLCHGRGRDAWDRIACNRWTEANPDRALQLSGNYVYQIDWTGGRRRRGILRIDPVADDTDEGTPRIITVDGS